MIDVSVIIINYKTPHMCIDCIKSLREKSNGFTYEIIVIDNNSKDDSFDILTGEETLNDVRFIWNSENLGTAKAFNQGCKNAQGKYLFYLNTDTLFINNAIKEMMDFMETNAKVGITGGNLFNSRMEPTHSYSTYFGPKYINKYASTAYLLYSQIFMKKLSLYFNYGNKPKSVYYVCAAATLIRKDVYEEIGGFDEDIFIYGDEALFAFKCKEKGYMSYNIPSAKIIHFEGDSFKKDDDGFSEPRYRRFIKGTSIFYNKAYGEKWVKKYLKKLYRGQKIRQILFKLFHNKLKFSYFSKANKVLKEIIRGENGEQ